MYGGNRIQWNVGLSVFKCLFEIINERKFMKIIMKMNKDRDITD